MLFQGRHFSVRRTRVAGMRVPWNFVRHWCGRLGHGRAQEWRRHSGHAGVLEASIRHGEVLEFRDVAEEIREGRSGIS